MVVETDRLVRLDFVVASGAGAGRDLSIVDQYQEDAGMGHHAQRDFVVVSGVSAGLGQRIVGHEGLKRLPRNRIGDGLFVL
jgi:hypothetical protein